jgi:hypothetical protein
MSTNAPRSRRGSTLSPAVQNGICQANKELDREVRQFMEYVPSAREESLSEFLFWRWRQLDERFNYQVVRPTTAAQEARSGADVLLQLWLVDSALVLPLLIQAKKFLLPHDSYRSKLRYPGGTGLQLEKLMASAAQWRLEPCYLIYAGGGNATRPREWVLHLVDAANIELLAKTPPGPLSLARGWRAGSTQHCGGPIFPIVRVPALRPRAANRRIGTIFEPIGSIRDPQQMFRAAAVKQSAEPNVKRPTSRRNRRGSTGRSGHSCDTPCRARSVCPKPARGPCAG